MTSNVGSQFIQERLNQEENKNTLENWEITKMQVMDLLKKTIRPEFLNRIDEVIMFTPLSKEDIKEIVSLQLKILEKSLESSQVKIKISDTAIDWLTERGYDPQYGARPVKRVLQRNILNELSKRIIAGDISKEKEIIIDRNGDLLMFKN